MERLILITNFFPYLPGEQFLETEVKYYCEYKNIDFMIMPRQQSKEKRNIPKCIMVNNFLSKENWKKKKYYYLFKSLSNKVFYQELFSENFFNVGKLKIFFFSIARYQMYYALFDKYLQNLKNLENTVVYTYWNDEATYALQSLKDKFGYKLISRIHGRDLYKNRQFFNYMPLKKLFIDRIDTLFVITESANSYLQEIYGFDNNLLKLSRLGVEDLNIKSLPSNKDTLHLVSCSFLVEIKRVDKIIDALEILSKRLTKIQFIWTHIGGGTLYNLLLQIANEKLSDISNIEFYFKGNVDNQEVYQFYKNSQIDVFVNVSVTEGVPVSIMEAMSCHIPIIAPNIGGISDMIQDGINGFLLSQDSTMDEIVESLANIKFFKRKNVREKSYKIFLSKYNAKNNYEVFLEEIMSI